MLKPDCTLAEVKQAVARAFAPDITVTLDAGGIVAFAVARTSPGHTFINMHNIIGLPYDLAFSDAEGLTIEASELTTHH